MYKKIVGNYVSRLTLDDLKDYCRKNYPIVTEKELKVIYWYLKNKWEELYDEDKSTLIELKKEVSSDTYNEIVKLLSMAYKFKNNN